MTAWSVRVHCCGETVCLFLRGAHDGAVFEQVFPSIDGSDPRLPDMEEVGFDAWFDALEEIDEQRPIAQVLRHASKRPVLQATIAIGSGQYRRWPLRCKGGCPHTDPFREAKLQQALDTLQEQGVSDVSLPLLATIVAKQRSGR